MNLDFYVYTEREKREKERKRERKRKSRTSAVHRVMHLFDYRTLQNLLLFLKNINLSFILKYHVKNVTSII